MKITIEGVGQAGEPMVFEDVEAAVLGLQFRPPAAGIIPRRHTQLILGAGGLWDLLTLATLVTEQVRLDLLAGRLNSEGSDGDSRDNNPGIVAEHGGVDPDRLGA